VVRGAAAAASRRAARMIQEVARAVGLLPLSWLRAWPRPAAAQTGFGPAFPPSSGGARALLRFCAAVPPERAEKRFRSHLFGPAGRRDRALGSILGRTNAEFLTNAVPSCILEKQGNRPLVRSGRLQQ